MTDVCFGIVSHFPLHLADPPLIICMRNDLPAQWKPALILRRQPIGRTIAPRSYGAEASVHIECVRGR